MPKKKESKNQVVSFELSAVKVEQLSKQPIIESNINVSEDGKWVIHRTTITDIKPMTYMQKVLA